MLAFPSTGHASIWDIIWGMSGPQMMGPVFHCEWDLQHRSGEKEDVIECRAIDYLFYHKLKPRPDRRVWLSLDSGVYFSTGKDSGENGRTSSTGSRTTWWRSSRCSKFARTLATIS